MSKSFFSAALNNWIRLGNYEFARVMFYRVACAFNVSRRALLTRLAIHSVGELRTKRAPRKRFINPAIFNPRHS